MHFVCVHMTCHSSPVSAQKQIALASDPQNGHGLISDLLIVILHRQAHLLALCLELPENASAVSVDAVHR